LDWSGNEIPSDNTKDFVDYFFGTNPICFLQIDRIYNTASVSALGDFFGYLSAGTLWGLSVGGSPKYNFAGDFRTLVQRLGLLPGLSMLYLDSQRMGTTKRASS
jgi:hypothetical protein